MNNLARTDEAQKGREPVDPATGLMVFADCRFVPAPWADGDSFLVRFPDGSERTPRLYGVDCIEWHVTDQADASRLRAQRRYFGISREDSQESIELAKDYGERAYQFVNELVAASRQRGVWEHTDWERLPYERRDERREANVMARSMGQQPPPGLPIDLNRAAMDELMRIPGIGEVLAHRIVEDRPYAAVDDVMRVPGIGPILLERFRPYVRKKNPDCGRGGILIWFPCPR